MSIIQFWEVTNDEGAIYLLINIRYTMIMADPESPIRNMSQSTSLVLFETNIRGQQYKTEVTTCHYL